MEYKFTNQPVELASSSLADILKNQLQAGKKVLWLLSGGSSLSIATLAATQIRDAANLHNLAITMTDERYGPIGHADENWQLLLDTGFDVPQAKLYRPLNGKSRAETVADLAAWLENELETADYKIGIFGMGTDGHTAGIKPASSAVHSDSLVADFDGDDFERITITPKTIGLLDEAIVQVSGNDKKDHLSQLLTTELLLNDQPAQVLKSIPKVTIYSNIRL